MNSQRLAVALSLLNLILLVWNAAHFGRASVGDGAILRGRGLQIVDDSGAVRASINVYPANPTYQLPDGKIGTPDTTLLRLIDRNGRPAVKMWASDQGAGLFAMGDTDATQAWLQSDGGESAVKLMSKDGRERHLRP